MNKMVIRSCVVGKIRTNCYLAMNKESNELFIVDPGDEADLIVRTIQEMKGKPEGILLTHGHYDHILAVEELKRKFRIPVIACEAEADTLLHPEKNLSEETSCSIKPDRLLKDNEEFTLAGAKIRVLHTPGHTKGSCCYYLKDEGVLFSGDTLFCCSVGRTDFPGGNTAEIIHSLHRLISELPEETEVYPGHEMSTTIGYEKRYNPFV